MNLALEDMLCIKNDKGNESVLIMDDYISWTVVGHKHDKLTSLYLLYPCRGWISATNTPK